MSASLDSALDPMEEIRFRKKHSRQWMEIQKETHFTFDEIERRCKLLLLSNVWSFVYPDINYFLFFGCLFLFSLSVYL